MIPTKRSSSSLASSQRAVRVSFSKSLALSRDRMGLIMDSQGAKTVVMIVVNGWAMYKSIYESMKDHVLDSNFIIIKRVLWMKRFA